MVCSRASGWSFTHERASEWPRRADRCASGGEFHTNPDIHGYGDGYTNSNANSHTHQHSHGDGHTTGHTY